MLIIVSTFDAHTHTCTLYVIDTYEQENKHTYRSALVAGEMRLCLSIVIHSVHQRITHDLTVLTVSYFSLIDVTQLSYLNG